MTLLLLQNSVLLVNCNWCLIDQTPLSHFLRTDTKSYRNWVC